MGPSVHSEYTNTCTRPWRGVRPPDGFRVGGERESCKSAGPSASQVARRAAASAREEAVVEALEGDAIPTGGVAADVERHVLAIMAWMLGVIETSVAGNPMRVLH